MPIPTISPYRMPLPSELPKNEVHWRPDPSRAVLLIHDMQRYFLDFFPPDDMPLRGMVDNIGRLVERFRCTGVPVAYTAQPGDMSVDQRGLLRDFWGSGMSAEPRHCGIIDELAPRPGEPVLIKWRYSAFHRTPLRELLREQGRDQLVVCGVYAHLGVLLTAFDAFALDVQPFLVADAISDFTPEEHRMALGLAARRCAVVTTTDALLRDAGFMAPSPRPSRS